MSSDLQCELSQKLVLLEIIFLTVDFHELLSASSSEARTSRDHFFLSPYFCELWHRGMSTCHITEVKQQWATLGL